MQLCKYRCTAGNGWGGGLQPPNFFKNHYLFRQKLSCHSGNDGLVIRRIIDIYLSGLLARRQNAWSQDGGNMRVIANGVNRCQYQDRPAGLLLWFVLVCRVIMPRSLMFQNYNYTRPKVPYVTVVSLYSCMSTGRWSLICSGFLQ